MSDWDDFGLDLDRIESVLDRVSPMEVRGRVTGLVGIIVKAALPEAWVGELCYIKNPHSDELVRAEVVGFDRHEALLMPLGELANIGMASEVIPTGRGLVVKVGDALLGRVVNGLGEPRDLAERGPLQTDQEYPVMAAPRTPSSGSGSSSHCRSASKRWTASSPWAKDNASDSLRPRAVESRPSSEWSRGTPRLTST